MSAENPNPPELSLDDAPRWPELYTEVAASIQDACGGIVQEISHVGSTSVPGLLARPILDVQILVDSKSMPLSDEVEARLEALGFVKRPGRLDAKLYQLFERVGGAGDEGYPCMVHVQGAWMLYQMMVNLKTYLTEHPDVAAEFAETKKKALANSTTMRQYRQRMMHYMKKITGLANPDKTTEIMTTLGGLDALSGIDAAAASKGSGAAAGAD